MAETDEVVFECRPRGSPPGRWQLFVAAFGLLWWPILLPWCELLVGAAGMWDHGPTWSASWTEVTVQALERRQTIGLEAPGPLWGYANPFIPGLTVPHILLAAIFLGALEMVRLAHYRSRRIGVTRSRALEITSGLFIPMTRTVVPMPGTARVVDGPGGARFESMLPGRPYMGRPFTVALGRLDALDLADLARALGAPPPSAPPPRSRRWVAITGVVSALLALAYAAPWRATVTVAVPAKADAVSFELDGPAWGGLRSKVSLFDGSEYPGGQTRFKPPTFWLEGVAVDGRSTDEFFSAPHFLELELGLLRRRETRYTRPEAAPAAGASRVRVTGRILLVDGLALPFDVTLAPGESVTLDLAKLREQAPH